jgi:ABC-type nickel/cobalt efflux system permease component RcnA
VNARRVVVGLVAALAVYFVLIGVRGIYLLTQSDWALRILGVAVLVLPLIGIWVVWAELRFGWATQRLAQALEADPVDDEPTKPELPKRPSGRIERSAADELFARRRADVQAAPDDWRRWYRLAVAYDLAGDRRRARAAMRDAIEKARQDS